MNHPRRVRLHRLLFLVPFALLGAALLVRARLPRPQTEGDKVLWQKAEVANSLTVEFNVLSRDKLQPFSKLRTATRLLKITERQGIRNVLRSFEHISAFTPGADKKSLFKRFHAASILAIVEVWIPGQSVARMVLVQQGRHYFLTLIHYSEKGFLLAP